VDKEYLREKRWYDVSWSALRGRIVYGGQSLQTFPSSSTRQVLLLLNSDFNEEC